MALNILCNSASLYQDLVKAKRTESRLDLGIVELQISPVYFVAISVLSARLFKYFDIALVDFKYVLIKASCRA